MKKLYTLITIITIGLNVNSMSHLDNSNCSFPYEFSSDTLYDNLVVIEPFENLNEIAYQKEDVLIDIDKNSYKTVKLGTQVWMAENLRTTRFNDGTVITLIADNAIWSNLITPGYCWYNNDEDAYKNPYGALYNLYTVSAGNICPSGWHLPSDAEWMTLESFFITNGYNYDGKLIGNKIGKAMASTTLWTSSSIKGSVGNKDYPEKRNTTGFSAFPGGYRCYCGTYYGIGNYGYWWTVTKSDAANAWFRYIGYGYVDLQRDNSSKLQGGGKTAFSIRCLKD